MNIRNLLITPQDYNNKEWSIPYKYKLKKGDFTLFYFGANHSFDPEDSQYPQLKEFWNEYLLTVKDPKNALIILEGRPIQKIFSSEDEAIKMASETGLINQLAKQAQIDVIGGEPRPSRITDALLNKFSKEEIAYYFFARDTMQWASMPKDAAGDYEEYIQKYLEFTKQNTEWGDFDFSLENMKAIHTKLFNNEFNPSDKDFLYSIVNPMIENTVINEVATECSTERDVLVAEKLLKYWNEADLFVVYGFKHAIVQEPVFKEAL